MTFDNPYQNLIDAENRYQFNGIEKLELPLLDINHTFYRTQDPAIGRWLQVDPKAEAMYDYSPMNAMGNNPATLTDPDGDLPALAAVGIGAAVGVFANGLNNLNNRHDFFKGAGQAAFFGAVAGATGHIIGTLAQGLIQGSGIGSTLGGGAFQAGMHGLNNGMLSEAQGGTFAQGFIAGGMSSVTSSGIEALGGGPIALIAGGGLSGGLGASSAGGEFWQGFGQGVMVSGLNHLAHSLGAGGTGDPPTKEHIQNAQHELSMALRDGKITEDEYWLMQEVLEQRISGNNLIGIARQSALNHKWEIAGLASGSLLSIASRSSTFGRWLFYSRSFGYQSKLFGRFHSEFSKNGVRGLFNQGNVRVGWSIHNGRHVFRAAAGRPGTINKWDLFRGPKF